MLEISNIEGVNFATASNVYKIYDLNHDKDIFESVIDGLILEKYADNELKEYIKDLPKDKKRIATLSLIGEDHLLWSKINELLKENMSSYQRLKSVYDILKEYVRIADVERKKHGEILTPFKELAEPMVKLVEKYDPEFWKNKNHKVLDSSAGYGTFLILAAYKFMVGLKDEIEDEEERFKWIVENCLYYGELQAKSVFSWLVAIDPYDEYKTNIYWGSFLSKEFDDHCKNVWGVEKFDLIIQNPPYQTRQEGNKKTQPLWHLFVQKSLTLLKEDGYMVMVHPDTWRGLGQGFKEVGDLLKSKDILYLNVNDRDKGVEIFGVQTSFDFYFLRNSQTNSKTTVDFLDDTVMDININDMPFIPNGLYNLFYKLVADDGHEKVTILSGSNYHTQRIEFMSKESDNYFKNPCIYTILKNGEINLWYSSVKNGHFGIPKVIWSNGTSMPIVDINGEFGLTQFAYAIVDKVENLEMIKNAMLNVDFIKLMSYSQGIKHRYNKNIIESFKKDFWKEFI